MFDLDGAGKDRPIVRVCKWVQCTQNLQNIKDKYAD